MEMFRRVLGKTLGFVGYTIQYGCIAHCAFEYIGEFVVVSIYYNDVFTDYFFLLQLNHLIYPQQQTNYLFCSVLVHLWSRPSSTMMLSSLND